MIQIKTDVSLRLIDKWVYQACVQAPGSQDTPESQTLYDMLYNISWLKAIKLS